MTRYAHRDALSDAVDDALSAFEPLVRTLLYYRGITDAHRASAFVEPDYDAHTHDPYAMRNMEDAVARLIRAFAEGESIVVYSDYDTDGIPAAAAMHDYFTQLGHEHFRIYIPHRHDEGYGLNGEAVQSFIDSGYDILLTIDCGTADGEHVQRAREAGMDVIICDHHEVNGHEPDAIVLNPKHPEDTYPFDELCGAGVAYKLIQALQQRLHTLNEPPVHVPPVGWEKWLLDMVGMATLSDMVPLYGENRVLACYGLQVLRKTRRRGLLTLLADLKLKRHQLTEDDIGFMIAPRINAASRMDTPEDAFSLLTTRDDESARAIATHLHKINDERKGRVAAIVNEIRKRMKQQDTSNVLVMGNPEWKPALLGLAAQTLMKECNKPVFLWGRESGTSIKGSCRSQGDVDVVALMKEAEPAFVEYGGHTLSGGFTVADEAVHTLSQQLNDAFDRLQTTNREDVVYIDATLTLDDVHVGTWRHIAKLAPFGEGNPKPLFLLQGVTPYQVRRFGRDKNHLELTFFNERGNPVKAIAFFAQEDSFQRRVVAEQSVDLIATMEKSFFGGRIEHRLRVVDIQ
jgi:single-stranded-DNA-specific exonuclease